MSARPWLPGEERIYLKAAIDQRVRALVPAPPSLDSVRRRAWRQDHAEQARATEEAYRERRNALARQRRVENGS